MLRRRRLTESRFDNEQSVGSALAVGGGSLPEQKITVIVTPSLRSKWMARPLSGGYREDRNNNASLFSTGVHLYPHQVQVPVHASTAGAANFPPGGIPLMVNNGHIDPRGQPPPYLYSNTQNHTGVTEMTPPDQLSAPMQTSRNQRGRQPKQKERSPPPAPMPSSCTTTSCEHDKPDDESSQSKPPAEEALVEIRDEQRVGPGALDGSGNKTCLTKARVSLPSSPPEVAESFTATIQNISSTAAISDGKEEAEANPKSPITPRATSPAHDSTATQPQDEQREPNGHNRVPSIFTEAQIKKRHQTWARIPMPLDHHKPGNSSPTNSSAPDIHFSNLRVPPGEKVGTNIGSDRSSPSRVVLTPETGNVYPSPMAATFDEATSKEGRSSRPATPPTVPPPSVKAPQNDVESSAKLGSPITEMKATSLEKPSSTEEGTGQVSDEPRKDSAKGNSHKVDQAPSPQTQESTSTAADLPPAKSFEPPNDAQLDDCDRQGGDYIPREKSKNRKKKKKSRQAPDSQTACSTPEPVKGPHAQHSLNEVDAAMEITPSSHKPVEEEHSSLHPTMHVHQDAAISSSEKIAATVSPTVQDHDNSHQQRRDDSWKRSRKQEDLPATKPHPPAAKLEMAELWRKKEAEQGHISLDEPHGRQGYRENAGGSLKIRKNRRGPRPSMTWVTESKIVERQPWTLKSTPSSELAPKPSNSNPSCSDPLTLDPLNSIDVQDGKGSVKVSSPAKSRLNPQAQEFLSPSKYPSKPIAEIGYCSFHWRAGARDGAASSKQNEHSSLSRPEKVNVQGKENVTMTEKLKLPEPQGSIPDSKRNHASKKASSFQGESRKPSAKGNKRLKGKDRDQAASSGMRTESKADVDIERKSEEKLGTKIDKKTDQKTKKKLEQKVQDKPDEAKSGPRPGDVATAEAKASLNTNEWPSLPGPRERAPSKTHPSSVWGGGKVSGSEQQ